MDPQLFDTLYRRYYSSLFLYAYSLAHNRADAEDLTANAFVKALTTFRQGTLRAWLYTVLRNEWYDLQKRRRREVHLDEEQLGCLPDDDRVWQSYLQDELLRRLYRVVNELPPREREVMLLTIQTDAPDEELAKILGITATYVRVLRHRAKQHILKVFEEDSL